VCPARKSTVARRLAADLSLPFLSPDTVGQTLQASRGIRVRDAADDSWIAYDVLFRLCEEFVGAGLSVVLEVNPGWAFQWDWLDRLAARQPGVRVLPIVLRCSRHICLERIRQRHAGDPSTGAPELYETDPKILAVFDFLEQLQRPDVVAIDASHPADAVYSAIRQAAAAVTCHVMN
jgi:predicted kinase